MSFIEKISDYIGIEKILSSIEELIDYFLKPFHFFERFFQRPFREKLIQIVIYSLLLILIGYITIEDSTLRELAKGLLGEIAITFSISLVLILSDFIISKIENRKSQCENIIFFVILAKLLLGPFQILFFALFMNYEDYNFFFLANLVFLFQNIYVLFFSARVFNSRIKYILMAIFFNLIVLNLFSFALDRLRLDKYSTFESEFYIDQILKERFEKGKALKYPYSTPVYRVLTKVDNSIYGHFVFATPMDSLAIGSFEGTEEYHAGLKNNIKILDTMQLNLKFKRNIEFYNKLSMLYASVDSLLNERKIIWTEDKIERVRVIMSNDSKKELYKEYFFKIPDRILKINIELLNNEIETEKISTSSMIPIRLVNYLYPLMYLTEDKNLTPN